MTIFEQIFGSRGSLVTLSHVNGMSGIHEKGNTLSFSMTPTHKADCVSITYDDRADLFNITLYKRQMPYQYFQQVRQEDVIDVLEKSTDLLF